MHDDFVRGSASRAVYVISVAAELAGMHPQTLRFYERKGLVDPARTEGWSADRLTPLLAGLLELLPWLEQWHNDLDPAYGMGMGEYFKRFQDEEARSLDLTLDAIKAWRPGNTTEARRGRRKKES